MYKNLQALNTLLLTKERDLPALHQQQFGGTGVSLERLQSARGLVARLIEGLRHPDDRDLWARIDAAFAAITEEPEPTPVKAEAPEAAAPPPAPAPAGPSVPKPAPARPFRPSPGAVSPWVKGAKPSGPAAVEATAMIDGDVHGEALPFKAGAGAPPLPAVDLGPGPDAGATAMLDDASSDAGATAFLEDDAPVAEALPFAAHPPQGAAREQGSELDLEGYAQLCAECALWPDHTAAINERYGLTSAVARGKADLAWQKKMGKDAALRAKWQACFDAHKARLRRA